MTRHLPRGCNYFAARWSPVTSSTTYLLTPYDRPTSHSTLRPRTSSNSLHSVFDRLVSNFSVVRSVLFNVSSSLIYQRALLKWTFRVLLGLISRLIYEKFAQSSLYAHCVCLCLYIYIYIYPCFNIQNCFSFKEKRSTSMDHINST